MLIDWAFTVAVVATAMVNVGYATVLVLRQSLPVWVFAFITAAHAANVGHAVLDIIEHSVGRTSLSAALVLAAITMLYLIERDKV